MGAAKASAVTVAAAQTSGAAVEVGVSSCIIDPNHCITTTNTGANPAGSIAADTVRCEVNLKLD